jgi:hypothetical protein
MKHRNLIAALTPQGRNSKALETRELSDRSKLVWQQFVGPAQQGMQAVQVALNNAQELVARLLAQAEGLDPDMGWRLHVGKMRWEKHPVQVEAEE